MGAPHFRALCIWDRAENSSQFFLQTMRPYLQCVCVCVWWQSHFQLFIYSYSVLSADITRYPWVRWQDLWFCSGGHLGQIFSWCLGLLKSTLGRSLHSCPSLCVLKCLPFHSFFSASHGCCDDYYLSQAIRFGVLPPQPPECWHCTTMLGFLLSFLPLAPQKSICLLGSAFIGSQLKSQNDRTELFFLFHSR